MKILLAWWAIGIFSAMAAAWQTGELGRRGSGRMFLLAGTLGPLLWTKPFLHWLRAHRGHGNNVSPVTTTGGVAARW